MQGIRWSGGPVLSLGEGLCAREGGNGLRGCEGGKSSGSGERLCLEACPGVPSKPASLNATTRAASGQVPRQGRHVSSVFEPTSTSNPSLASPSPCEGRAASKTCCPPWHFVCRSFHHPSGLGSGALRVKASCWLTRRICGQAEASAGNFTSRTARRTSRCSPLAICRRQSCCLSVAGLAPR